MVGHWSDGPADANCDDGLFCNGDERSVDGQCSAGLAPTLSDGLYWGRYKSRTKPVVGNHEYG